MTTKHTPPKMAQPRTPDYFNNLPNNAAEQDFLAAPTALRSEKATPQMRIGAVVTAAAIGIGFNFVGVPNEAAAEQHAAIQTVEQ